MLPAYNRTNNNNNKGQWDWDMQPPLRRSRPAQPCAIVINLRTYQRDAEEMHDCLPACWAHGVLQDKTGSWYRRKVQQRL